ncbi:hypothetical protein AB0J28_09505 [Streptosporangium canum]|uniref:hypothetical protein n=1 Tax=Streptosporangium canum TaxID=324952 RepID=UPI0034331F19
MRLPAYVAALASAATVTAAAGVLALYLMEPAELDWSPFVYVAAVSLVLAAAAGAVHLIQVRRTRRFIARLRAEGAAMAEEGYFQPAQERRLLIDAYDVFEEES